MLIGIRNRGQPGDDRKKEKPPGSCVFAGINLFWNYKIFALKFLIPDNNNEHLAGAMGKSKKINKIFLTNPKKYSI
jgi:hypothetical protein